MELCYKDDFKECTHDCNGCYQSYLPTDGCVYDDVDCYHDCKGCEKGCEKGIMKCEICGETLTYEERLDGPHNCIID
jgi:hypothetical protein